MRIVALTNRKGGTGKTTLAVNLAAELAAAGERVLLIDLDSQGHAALGLGVEPGTVALTAHEALFGDAPRPLLEAAVATRWERLWLAPADTRFEHDLARRRLEALREALKNAEISQRFDWVLIDTPPTLDALLFNALLAAQRAIVPFVPHPLALAGVRQLVRVLFHVMTRGNPEIRVLGFVPVMYQERVRQHREVLAHVQREYGAPRLLPAVRTDVRLAEAMAAGKPIRDYAPKSRGAEDIALVAQAIRSRS